MEKNCTIQLIIGEDLSKIIIDDDGEYLKNEIKKLRDEKDFPLVHITDEKETKANCFDIIISDKKISQETNLNNNKKELIGLIMSTLKEALK